jgi:O-methyltransferase
MLNLSAKIVCRSINKAGFDVIKHYPSSIDPSFPKDFGDLTIETIRKVKPYTMTSNERLAALCDAVSYVVKNQIVGDVVECGVWKGGSMMAVADTLLHLGEVSRDLYLFDTFEGMTAPSDKDLAITGEMAQVQWDSTKNQDDTSTWCYASVDEVKKAVFSVGYPQDKTHFVQGKVEDTLPHHALDKISILRLDTDWYESTRHELIHLFPRISVGGILIIDDYGWWEGARRAVDEYIAENKIQIFLNRIDCTGRIGVVNGRSLLQNC